MTTNIPYGRHLVDEDDIKAVVGVLEGDWLTTGPTVDRFEEKFADLVGVGHAVAVSNGTAGLHLSILAAGIGPGDEVIVPALTFVASANCARYAGADVVFADVRDDTLTIDSTHVRSLVTERTKAIVAVDYAGLPCDLDELREIADQCDATLIEDACHAPGALYRGRPVGSIADATTFSFHPVKHLTTGEGGMITTSDSELADKLRRLRSHGIDVDHRQRAATGTWAYDMVSLGFNYRMPDINAALGLSQLEKLQKWLKRREAVALRYEAELTAVDDLHLPTTPSDRTHAWHLYPVRFTDGDAGGRRRNVFDSMRSSGVGVNVHYQPVYLHSYYRELGYRPGLCPVAEQAYSGLLSLPMWPGLSDGDQERVIELFTTAARRSLGR